MLINHKVRNDPLYRSCVKSYNYKISSRIRYVNMGLFYRRITQNYKFNIHKYILENLSMGMYLTVNSFLNNSLL